MMHPDRWTATISRVKLFRANPLLEGCVGWEDGKMYTFLLAAALLLQGFILETPALAATNPWKAQYYNNRFLSGSPTFTVVNMPAINNDWGWNSGPGNGVGKDNFSVRWTSSQNAPGKLRVDFYAGQTTVFGCTWITPWR